MFPLTPQRLAILYDALRAQPPFHRWRLPPADEVEFRTPARRDIHGEHVEKTPPSRGAVHTVTVSIEKHAHFNSVLLTLAHEMCHVAQAVAKIPGRHRGHDTKDFVARTRRVCRTFGWDERNF